MTPGERLISALRMEIPDRVPCFEDGIDPEVVRQAFGQ